MILQQIYSEKYVLYFIRVARFYIRYYKKYFGLFFLTHCILRCKCVQPVDLSGL